MHRGVRSSAAQAVREEFSPRCAQNGNGLTCTSEDLRLRTYRPIVWTGKSPAGGSRSMKSLAAGFRCSPRRQRIPKFWVRPTEKDRKAANESRVRMIANHRFRKRSECVSSLDDL